MNRVPIIKIDDKLIATVLGDLSDHDALQLQDDLGSMIEQTGAVGVLLDLTIVDIVDSFLGRLINDVVVTSRLLGAETVIVGIQPAVAMTLVELGLEFTGISTALTMDKGRRKVNELIAASRTGPKRGR